MHTQVKRAKESTTVVGNESEKLGPHSEHYTITGKIGQTCLHFICFVSIDPCSSVLDRHLFNHNRFLQRGKGGWAGYQGAGRLKHTKNSKPPSLAGAFSAAGAAAGAGAAGAAAGGGGPPMGGGGAPHPGGGIPYEGAGCTIPHLALRL